jgi:hypothetical protein
MPQSSTLDVGMEVHQESIAVAYVTNEHHAEVVYDGAIGTRQDDLDQIIRKLPSNSKPLVFVSNAGPCGDGLYRDLTQKGSVGWVVAPSLIPKKAGDHVQADRRDAVQLARLRPARDEALRDLKAATSRLTAVLLRQDRRDTGQANGSPAPLRGLAEVVCPHPCPTERLPGR